MRVSLKNVRTSELETQKVPAADRIDSREMFWSSQQSRRLHMEFAVGDLEPTDPWKLDQLHGKCSK